MQPTDKGAFRCAVIAVFQDENGNVLLCERADADGVWQLPQGGVDQGESSVAALRREMREEIGTDQFDILRVGEGETRYVYPLPGHYFGQSLKWYLVRLRPGIAPAVTHGSDGFQDFRWVGPDAVLAAATPWKRAAYAEGLAALGLILKVPASLSFGAKPTAS